MNILHILPYCPVPPNYGARLRIHNLLKGMSRNNDVTVVFIGTDEEAAMMRSAYNGSVRKVIACPPQMARKMTRSALAYSFIGRHSMLYLLGENMKLRDAVRDELERRDYDVVHTEFPHMAFFDIPEGPLKVLDSHNIEYDNFLRMWTRTPSLWRRLQYYNEYRKFRPEETDAFRRQDLLLFCSERDLSLAEKLAPRVLKRVIPNGVDCEFFKPAETVPEPYTMVYTGMMHYLPNHDGAVYFLDEIFPLIARAEPRAKVTIVGGGPSTQLLKRAAKNVVITGYVDDVRPYIGRAQVSVVPLRMGGGTRLKILESLAMMRPTVATPVGSEGIGVTHGENIMIADDPAAFADSVLRIFRDRELATRLARNGYDLVKDRYEWSVVGASLETAYRDAMEMARSH